MASLSVVSLIGEVMYHFVTAVLCYTLGLLLICSMYPSFRMYVLEAILGIIKPRHLNIDGSRIFISGSSIRRKIMIKAESIYVGFENIIPAGCYCMHLNEIYITKYSLDTEYGIDTYGSMESIRTLANVVSHEFIHMLLAIEHGKKVTVLFDNLCSGSESINNSGMDGD